MSEIHHSELSSLKILQQRVSIATWVITLALSLRGLFVFYGMKEKGSFEQILAFVTDPVVHLFSFAQIENIGIPGIGVLFAAVSILLIGQIIQMSLWAADMRREKARHYVFRHAARSK